MSLLATSKTAPDLSLNTLDGSTFTLSKQTPKRATIIIFYRGNHCPICRGYLKDVAESYAKFAADGYQIVVASMDTKEKAIATRDEVAKQVNSKNIPFPIAYGLTEETARAWGLYLSNGALNGEPKVFSEPGVITVKADGTVLSVMLQSTPFTRPDLEQLRGGLNYIFENNYPTRGTFTHQK